MSEHSVVSWFELHLRTHSSAEAVLRKRLDEQQRAHDAAMRAAADARANDGQRAAKAADRADFEAEKSRIVKQCVPRTPPCVKNSIASLLSRNQKPLDDSLALTPMAGWPKSTGHNSSRPL